MQPTNINPELLLAILLEKEKLNSDKLFIQNEGVFNRELAHAAACYSYPELTALIGVKTWPCSHIPFTVEDHKSNYIKAIALLHELPATKARAYSCGFLFQRTLHN